MGKYLTNFKTKEEYEDFKASGEYITPNVSFIETAGSVINDSYQVQGDEGVGYLYFENVPPMVEPLAFSSLINDGTRIIPSFLCGFNSQGKEENITVHKIAAPYGYTWNDMKITEDFLREFMSIGDIVEITEEEFYNLDGGGSSLIEFTIDGISYQAEEGMTWQEFVESSYNDGRVSVSSNYVGHDGMWLTNTSNGMSAPWDVIVPNYNYEYADV